MLISRVLSNVEELGRTKTLAMNIGLFTMEYVDYKGVKKMKREILIGENTIQLLTEESIFCEYRLLIDEIDSNYSYILYGIRISVKDSEESCEVWNISHRADEMVELAQKLCRLSVTPCSLHNVLEDYLLED